MVRGVCRSEPTSLVASVVACMHVTGRHLLQTRRSHVVWVVHRLDCHSVRARNARACGSLRHALRSNATRQMSSAAQQQLQTSSGYAKKNLIQKPGEYGMKSGLDHPANSKPTNCNALQNEHQSC